jgi:hypothetical protein
VGGQPVKCATPGVAEELRRLALDTNAGCLHAADRGAAATITAWESGARAFVNALLDPGRAVPAGGGLCRCNPLGCPHQFCVGAKQRRLSNGRSVGGGHFGVGALAHLLQNRFYTLRKHLSLRSTQTRQRRPHRRADGRAGPQRLASTARELRRPAQRVKDVIPSRPALPTNSAPPPPTEPRAARPC